jgi:hypothetical protein
LWSESELTRCERSGDLFNSAWDAEDVTGVVVAEAIWVICFVVMAVWMARYGWVRSAPGIVRRLKNSRNEHRVRLGHLDGIGLWNPADSRSSGRVYGPGVGVYRLDDEGQVHLNWTPQSGQEQHLVGPLPVDGPNAPGRPRARKMAWTIAGIYGGSLVLGFVLGYRLSDGSSGRRVVVGLFGGLGGYVAMYVVMLVVLTALGMRHRSRKTHN